MFITPRYASVSDYLGRISPRDGVSQTKGVTFIIASWLTGVLLFYIPNNGGSGLDMPQNILAWWTAGLILTCIALTLPSRSLFQKASYRGIRLLPLGAVLWSLPLLWSPSRMARGEAVTHVLALWLLLGLFWVLYQLPHRRVRLCHWLNILWLAALMQALFGFIQAAVLSHTGGFSNNRPLGIFQQVNVLASFLSTGLVCLLVTLQRRKKPHWLLRAAAYAALLFLPFMLVLLQSRVGKIGGLAGAMVLTATARHLPLRDHLRLWLVMSLGVLLALFWQYGMIERLLPNTTGLTLPSSFTLRADSHGSNVERWRIMQNTWQMIIERPWLGTGYGGFERVFAQTALEQGGGIVSQTVTHPHNELLYAWAEGGLPALGGVLLMIASVLSDLWQRGGLRWRGIALLLPIALHMNLEYPLYQSVPHGMVLIMLLSLVISPVRYRSAPASLADKSKRWVMRVCILSGGLTLMVIMCGALQTQQRLTYIERISMANQGTDESAALNSLSTAQLFRTRIDFDRNIALLMRFNQTRDPELLMAFSSWADNYLTQHNDLNITVSRLAIARRFSPRQYLMLCQRAQRVWPHNDRVRCDAR